MSQPMGESRTMMVNGVPAEVAPIRRVMPLDTDRTLWSRQGQETDREWSWFLLYRNLFTGIRSVDRAYLEYRKARAVHNGNDPDKIFVYHATQTVRDMSVRWSWRTRAIEFDAWRDAEKQYQIAQAKAKACDEVAQLGKNMRKTAAMACEALFDSLYDETIDENGEVVVVFKNRLSPSAIVSLAKAGVELERLALGMDTGKRGATTHVHVGVAVQTGAGISRSDDALLEQAAAVLQARKLQEQVIQGEAITMPARPAKPTQSIEPAVVVAAITRSVG